MRRFYNIFAIAIAMIMTSCLTEDPRDQLYEDDIYNNANNIYRPYSTTTLVVVQTVKAYRELVVVSMIITH